MSQELVELGLNLQIVDVSRLVRWERNFNPHSPEQIDDLAGSAKRWGQYKNVVGKTSDNDKIKIYAGEGFWRGLEKSGKTRIVVNVRDDLSDAEAEALGVQDNFSPTPRESFDLETLRTIIDDKEFPQDMTGMDEEWLEEVRAMMEMSIIDDGDLAQQHSDRIKPTGDYIVVGFGGFAGLVLAPLVDDVIECLKEKFGDDPDRAMNLLCEHLVNESLFC